MKKKNIVLWLTGLSGSGKTTLAKLILEELKKKNILVHHLDGDEVRGASTEKLGFSPEDRDKNIKMAITLTKDYQNKGFAVIASFITPYAHQRRWGRSEIGGFIEIFVDSSIEVCERRDTKGLYKKAREGGIDFFTGINDPYEKPDSPDIHLRTDLLSEQESVEKIMEYLKGNYSI